jgi:hypothetical protein
MAADQKGRNGYWDEAPLAWATGHNKMHFHGKHLFGTEELGSRSLN